MANSGSGDKLGDVPFIKTEPAKAPTLQGNKPSELSQLFRGTVEDNILADRMGKVCELESATGSVDSDSHNDNVDREFPGQQVESDGDLINRSQKGAHGIHGQ